VKSGYLKHATLALVVERRYHARSSLKFHVLDSSLARVHIYMPAYLVEPVVYLI
jgi:hypothetical protein